MIEIEGVCFTPAMSDTSQEVRTADAAVPAVLDDSSAWPDHVEALVQRPFPGGGQGSAERGDRDAGERHQAEGEPADGEPGEQEPGDGDPLDDVLVSTPDFHFLVLRDSGGFDEDNVDQLDARAAEFEAEQELLALILDERWGPRSPAHPDPEQDLVTPRIAEAIDVAREYVEAWVLEDRVVLLGVRKVDEEAPFELCVAVVKRSGHVAVPADESLWPEFVEELLARSMPGEPGHHLVRLRAGAPFEDLPSDGHRVRQHRECRKWQDHLADDLEERWGPGLSETDGRLAAVLRRFPAFGDDPGEVDAWVREGKLVLIGIVPDDVAPVNLFVLVAAPARRRS